MLVKTALFLVAVNIHFQFCTSYLVKELDKEIPDAVAATSLYNGTIIHLQVSAKCKEGQSAYVYWLITKMPCFTDESFEFDAAMADAQSNSTVHVSSQSYFTCTKDLQQVDIQNESPLEVKAKIRKNDKKNGTVTGKSDPGSDPDKNQVFVITTGTGLYKFVAGVRCAAGSLEDELKCEPEATVYVAFEGKHGYLPAVMWPLLPFYIVMCLVYVLYGILWLVMMACNWKDLLRIQYWISAVIFIGMLEKALFLAEYEHLNQYKYANSIGLIFFAEVISSLKRSLARVLVIIVSLGYGIVKPRLGPAMQKVVAVGVLFFVLGTVEGCMRQWGDRTSRMVQLADIPMAVLDAIICWWIFSSLVETMRTLRLRRNVTKLALYRHFTNTLILAVLASLVFMIWNMSTHRFNNCIKSWRQLWVDEAFWHMLFSIILFIIMILWRPSANSQRFAFSPLLDDEASDDEDDSKTDLDGIVNDALGEIGKRNLKTTQIQPKNGKTVDENLKWIEDNIPSSVADSTLPSLLDSDEEVMTSKYEMSKME